jgi:hypothetical protein
MGAGCQLGGGEIAMAAETGHRQPGPPGDPADVVARVAAAKRAVLLRAHRRRLGFEDLEDCYSQATLELIARGDRSKVICT